MIIIKGRREKREDFLLGRLGRKQGLVPGIDSGLEFQISSILGLEHYLSRAEASGLDLGGQNNIVLCGEPSW